ncbi:MAG: tetratricopeptide repeat protein, partial [Chloroflexota bacterium]
MTPRSFIGKLRATLPEDCWFWHITALHQDPIIWHELSEGDLGLRALSQLGSHPQAWSPASLALLSLECSLPLSSLQQEPLQALPPEVGQRAARAYQDFTRPAEEAIPQTLAQAGLLAAALRERRRRTGSWEGIRNDLESRPLTDWSTALACLYGLIPDPLALLLSLLQHKTLEKETVETVLHIFLCQSLSPQDQLTFLLSLLAESSEFVQGQMLQGLASKRKSLAKELAENLLRVSDSPDDEKPPLTSHEAGILYSLADDPPQAQQALSVALEETRLQQAELAAQLAHAAARAGDLKTATSSWEQAVVLAPERQEYKAQHILALLAHNQPEVARAKLSDQQRFNEDPNLLIAAAGTAYHIKDFTEARSLALNALEILSQSTQAIPPPDICNHLSTLFLDLELLSEAIQMAERTTQHYPQNAEAWRLLAQAHLLNDNSFQAYDAAHMAVAFDPQRPELRRLLAETLEACEEWDTALQERRVLMAADHSALDSTRPIADQISDYCALAQCALNVGQPQEAIKACRQAMELDAQDGSVHALMSASLYALGETEQAQEYFNQATAIAPRRPEPWLSLAQAQHKAGHEDKALETLRAAVHAVPQSAEVHLTLGEALLASQAPSQALPVLRRATTLTQQKGKGSLTRAYGKANYRRLSSQIAARLGETLCELGHLEEAREVLVEAYEKAPTHPLIARQYARVHLSLKDPQTALSALAVVVATHPQEIQPYIDYADTLLTLGEDPQEALRVISDVLRRNPEHQVAKALYAEALQANGDFPVARAAYQEIVSSDLVNQPDWQARIHLGHGQTELALGQPEVALG